MKHKRILKIHLAVLAGSLIAVLAAYLFLMQLINIRFGDVYPDSATFNNMHVVKRRILHYAQQHNELPRTVDELPLLEGFNNNNTDYWGGKIIIRVEGTTVSLISCGKDRKPGGTGANLDLVAVFEAKTSSGAWADESDEGSSSWKKRPVLRWKIIDYR